MPPTEPGMVSSTKPGAQGATIGAGDNLAAPLIAGSLGCVPSLSRIRQCLEHSMWPAMATSLLAAQATLPARSGAFAPVMRRTRASHQRLIKARKWIWAAAWFLAARLTPAGWLDK